MTTQWFPMEVVKIGTSSRKQILVRSWAAENVLLSIFSVFLEDPWQLSGVINSNRYCAELCLQKAARGESSTKNPRDTEEKASKSASLCFTNSNPVAPGLPCGVGTDVLT